MFDLDTATATGRHLLQQRRAFLNDALDALEAHVRDFVAAQTNPVGELRYELFAVRCSLVTISLTLSSRVIRMATSGLMGNSSEHGDLG